MRERATAAGLTPTGPHHEIYLGDPRRSDPQRLRTVLRQPIGLIRRAAGPRVSKRSTAAREPVGVALRERHREVVDAELGEAVDLVGDRLRVAVHRVEALRAARPAPPGPGRTGAASAGPRPRPPRG